MSHKQKENIAETDMNQISQSHVSTITETVTLLSDLILKQQQLLTQRPLLPWECEDEAEPAHLPHVPPCLTFLTYLLSPFHLC